MNPHTHPTAAVVFWCSVLVIGYAYIFYPALLAMTRSLGHAWQRGPDHPTDISVVIAARNAEQRIVVCVVNTLEAMRKSHIGGEIIVVSDGSTDATAELVRQLEDPQVRVIELLQHRGKAIALNHGCSAATHEIVVFADTRQRWDDQTLVNLLKNFEDPQVGAVSGELVLREADGTLAGVGLYWRMEKWMRQRESALHSCLGVTGAMCAVRRELFSQIPPGTVLDDVYWPMKVVLAGHRVVHDQQALVYDRLPARRRDELKRKIRTLGGNFQLICRLPSLLSPRRNPVFVPFVSHKVARLLVPWAMIGAFFSSAMLADGIYRIAFFAQLGLYVLAFVGLYSRAAGKSKLVSTASAFVFLNAACFLAFFVWLAGATEGNWHSIQYDEETSEFERTGR